MAQRVPARPKKGVGTGGEPDNKLEKTASVAQLCVLPFVCKGTRADGSAW